MQEPTPPQSQPQTPPPGGGGDQDIAEISHPLFLAKGWIKLVGVMSVIYGVGIALSLVGIIIAWLPIWMGVLLWQTSNSLENAYLSRDKAAFIYAMNKLKLYFTIQGVLLLASIIITVLGLIIGGGSMFALFNSTGG